MPRASGSSHPPLGGSHQGPPGRPVGPKTKNSKDDDKDSTDPGQWDADKVRRLHYASDKDTYVGAAHHSLGPRGTQAAPGNHEHRLIGIWLYRASDGTHNSSGNYQAISWTDYKHWDKEYYAKQSNSEIVVLKAHLARITYRTSFEGNGTGRRGISLFQNGAQNQRMEVPTLGGGATNTQVADHAFDITLAVGEVVQIQCFQNSGVNLATRNGMHITHVKIAKTHPQKIDVQGLTSGGIVPAVPGPDIASKQFFLNGSW